MKFTLELQKFDGGNDGYSGHVVFGQAGDVQTQENRHRPRPKLTLDPEHWKELGAPISIDIEVEPSKVESKLESALA